MFFDLTGHPMLIRLALLVSETVFIFGFITAFCLMFVVLHKTGTLISHPDERSLSKGERMAKSHNRFNRFLVDAEFRTLRRCLFSAWLITLTALCTMALVIEVFGKRV